MVGPEASSSPLVPAVTGQRIPACAPALPSNSVQHRDRFLTFSFWHKQDVPLARKRPWRNYTVGLIVYVSTVAGWGRHAPALVCAPQRVCHIITADIASLFCIFISYWIMMIFCFCTQSSADPPGGFNSPITHHSTISARASVGWIRVTWTGPDCNQSENNECRTKSGTITPASLTFLSLSVFIFFCFALFLPPPPLESREAQTKSRTEGKKVSSKRSWLQENLTWSGERLRRGRHRVGQQGSTSLHSQGLANELITWGDSPQLT